MATRFFDRAHDFQLGILNTGVVGEINQYYTVQKAPLDALVDNIIAAAIHDAKERSDAPQCYPQTRIAVQRDITKWIYQDDSPSAQKILWVTGPAGAGKSAIAGSLAESCRDEGMLAASFFFSAFFGSPYCRSRERLISTLVYQLIQHKELVDLKSEVLSIIQHNPVIFGKRLKEQLELLILKPLRKIGRQSSTKWPKVILIDGFDECDARDPSKPSTTPCSQRENEAVQEEILSALLYATNDPSFPFRIIVVSRPDFIINDFFTHNDASTKKIFLDEDYEPDADIAHFVKGKFAEIRRRFTLPESWPPHQDEVVRTIVHNASGQFIYAATAMQYIADPGEPPSRKLNRILRWDAQKCNSTQSPFEHLDALYLGILQTSPDTPLAVRWIHAILELHSESGDSVTTVKAFLEAEPGEMERLLGNLSSLLSITDTFRFFHKSLLDYLGSAQRCGKLYVDNKATMTFLQSRWYKLLKNRGPQIELTEGDRRIFLQHYAGSFTTRYFQLSPQGHCHEHADVEWWLDMARAELAHHRETRIESVRDIVHETVSGFIAAGIAVIRTARHGEKHYVVLAQDTMGF